MYILPVLIDPNGDLNFIVKNNNMPFTINELKCPYDIKLKKLFITFQKCEPVDGKAVPYTTKINVIQQQLDQVKDIFIFLHNNNKIKFKKEEPNNYKIVDVSKKYNDEYPKILTDKKTGLQYVNISKGTILYKGMLKTESNTNNIDNLYAARIGWFTSYKNIAQNYLKTNNTHSVYQYEAIRSLKLFILNKHNLQLLVIKLLTELSENIKNAKKYIDKINIIKATTGYLANYKEQLTILKEIHPFINNKIKRKKHWLHNYDARYNVNGDIYSELYQDLNRISIATVADKKLAKIICKAYNLDGYYNYNVPSLWEYGEYKEPNPYPNMNEEIGLCIQRGAVKRV